MPGPPPPPPPPGPPPPSAVVAPPPSNVALLADIRKGTGLRKVPDSEKHDRSGAVSDAPNPGPTSSGSGRASSNTNIASTGNVMGGLFANGMPTLRPTGSKFVSNIRTSNQNSPTLVKPVTPTPRPAVPEKPPRNSLLKSSVETHTIRQAPLLPPPGPQRVAPSTSKRNIFTEKYNFIPDSDLPEPPNPYQGPRTYPSKRKGNAPKQPMNA